MTLTKLNEGMATNQKNIKVELAKARKYLKRLQQ